MFFGTLWLCNEKVLAILKVQMKKDLIHVIHIMHMCLVGPLNPYILLQSWELTFLIGLTLLNTKLAKKFFFTYVL